MSRTLFNAKNLFRLKNMHAKYSLVLADVPFAAAAAVAGNHRSNNGHDHDMLAAV
jgi:hypothetical protein